MENTLLKPVLLLLALAVFSCQPGTGEDKTIASTHPKLEKQLARDSVKTPVSSNEAPRLYDQYRITLQEYESSGNYAVADLYGGKLSLLDEASHADARKYKTALREGLNAGINFAGKYTVVSISCGTACQTHYVVDRENGRVLDKLSGSMGARYNRQSRLFILNPPDAATDYSQCAGCIPEVFVFANGKFKKADFKLPQ